jgi:putative oxidoreductase
MGEKGAIVPKLDARPKFLDLGLLLIRLGIGASMAAFHGYGKLTGGPERWERIGGSMGNLGIDFAPVVWGFLAMFSEFFCSILFGLGLFFRPAAGLLACTMLVAAIRHLSLPPGSENSGWSGASHALELLVVYVGLLLAGPGRYVIFPRLK